MNLKKPWMWARQRNAILRAKERERQTAPEIQVHAVATLEEMKQVVVKEISKPRRKS